MSCTNKKIYKINKFNKRIKNLLKLMLISIN